MRALFRFIATLLFILIIGVGLFFIGMRFHDGPLEIISGGPFKSGESELNTNKLGFY